MPKSKTETTVPKGECKQCYVCSKQHNSFFGIGEKPCPCEGHVGGCPPHMIQR